MRTVFRLVRRYVTAAFAIVLTIFTVSTALFAGLVIYFGIKGYAPPSQLSVLADSFTLGADGQPVPQPAQPLDAYGFEWAMLLSDSGEVRWRYNLAGAARPPLHAVSGGGVLPLVP